MREVLGLLPGAKAGAGRRRRCLRPAEGRRVEQRRLAPRHGRPRAVAPAPSRPRRRARAAAAPKRRRGRTSSRELIAQVATTGKARRRACARRRRSPASRRRSARRSARSSSTPRCGGWSRPGAASASSSSAQGPHRRRASRSSMRPPRRGGRRPGARHPRHRGDEPPDVPAPSSTSPSTARRASFARLEAIAAIGRGLHRPRRSSTASPKLLGVADLRQVERSTTRPRSSRRRDQAPWRSHSPPSRRSAGSPSRSTACSRARPTTRPPRACARPSSRSCPTTTAAWVWLGARVRASARSCSTSFRETGWPCRILGRGAAARSRTSPSAR